MLNQPSKEPIVSNANGEYDVHLYAIVRIKVRGVKAESMEAAIEKAADNADLHDLLNQGSVGCTKESDVEYVEYAEEIPSAVVDVVGDDLYTKSRDFHYGSEGWKPGACPRVLVTVSGGIADYVSEPGVDVEVFDFDNYKADPEETGEASEEFADLAITINVPVEDGIFCTLST